MSDVLMTILRMSLMASYGILFVLVARFCLKKVPKIFSYSLWAVVFFRLICPVSFESVFSLFRAVPMPKAVERTTSTVVVPIMQGSKPIGSIPLVDANTQPVVNPVVNSVDPWQIALLLLGILWLVGSVAMILWTLISYIKLKRRVATACLVEEGIYESDGIGSPFVMGVIRPKIYLPVGLQEPYRGYVIEHERTHIRRRDYLIKPICHLVLCIHWFNPLVWLAYKLMIRDMEMSCDESVLKYMGHDIKKEYSYSLLSFARDQKVTCGGALAFGEHSSKSRIMNVMNYKKPSFWIIVVAFVLVVGLSIGLITNPKERASSDISVESIEKMLEQRSSILLIKGGAGSTWQGEGIKEALNMSEWKPCDAGNKSISGVTVYMDNLDGTEITVDEKKPMAVVHHKGKSCAYTVPKKTYDNLLSKAMLSSYFVPKEVVSAIVEGERTGRESINDVPNVEEYQGFQVGDMSYYLYQKGDNYYIENVYQYIHELTEDMYEKALDGSRGLTMLPELRLDIASLEKMLEARRSVMLINDQDGTGKVRYVKVINKVLNMGQWTPHESGMVSASGMTVYLGNSQGTEITVDCENPVAVVRHMGKRYAYHVPKDTYENMSVTYLSTSYIIYKELVDVIRAGEPVNDIEDAKKGSEAVATIHIMDDYSYTLYKHGDKYYMEDAFGIWKEITKDMYEKALKYSQELSNATPMATPVSTPTLAPYEEDVEAKAATWTKDTSLGVDMVTLDYASKDKVIFHGYFGLFVYDLKEQKLIRSLDLAGIGCDATQGDNYCEVFVSKDGNTVYLHTMSSQSMYIYDVTENTLKKTNFKEPEERFANYKPTQDVMDVGTDLMYSYKAVDLGNGLYGYLYANDWTLGGLTYVHEGDMVFTPFK